MSCEACEEAPWHCAVCGEPMCSDCIEWLAPGQYAHRQCTLDDIAERTQVVMRIVTHLIEMPLKRLRRVEELVLYLSPLAARVSRERTRESA